MGRIDYNDYWSVHASLKPRSIVVYSKYSSAFRRTTQPLNFFERKDYSKGYLSNNSSKKLKQALELLIYTTNYKTVFVKKTQSNFRYKLNFVTLTLPSKQIHSDNEIIKNCLSPFLESWAKHREGFAYVWKAEVQTNGNIHFHLITNSFIHYKKLQSRWNKQVEKLGYVSRCKSENPNSTDVHALVNKKDIAAYLVSYMNKKDIYSKALNRWFKKYKNEISNRDIESFQLPKNYFKHIKRTLTSRVWSASKVLLKQPPSIDYEEYKYSKSWKMLEMAREHAIIGDYHTSYIFDDGLIHKFPEFDKVFKEYYTDLLKVQKKNVIKEIINEV